MSRATLKIVVIAVGLILPVAVLAQTGTVTVVPFSQAAPAMNALLLGMTAATLAVVAAAVLRRRSSKYASAFAALAVALFAATAYTAEVIIVVTGNECDQETTENYDSSGSGGNQILKSDCDNQIKIIDIDSNCGSGEAPQEEPQEVPTPSCTVGATLNPGDTCGLPLCD